MALSAGESKTALDAVTTYLKEKGRNGEFYREALELLEEAERLDAQNNHMCDGQSSGTACWREVTGQSECYFWQTDFPYYTNVTWSGQCAGGRAQGRARSRGLVLTTWIV